MTRQTKNTHTSTNPKPEAKICQQCGKRIEPFLRPAIFDLPAKWMTSQDVCSACLEKQKKSEDLRKSQQALDEAFVASRLSKRFQNRTFENFKPTPGTDHAFKIAKDFQYNKRGLLFFGPCGVGKTHLAASIAHREIGKRTVLFISCPEFLMDLREAMANANKSKSHQLLNLAKRVELLILDDIGAERASSWVQETFFVLVNYRYEQLLPTILTTNCSLTELEGKLTKRITSRLAEMCRIIKMSGTDWRLGANAAFKGGNV